VIFIQFEVSYEPVYNGHVGILPSDYGLYQKGASESTNNRALIVRSL